MISILKRSPFLLILLPLILFYCIVLSHHWIPVHDTLSSFFIGYSFFSHFAEYGTFPFWANYLNWGQPINMPLMANISPFFIFLGPFVKFFPQANLMSLYYISIFFEELLLAVGTYLLCSRFYKHTFTKIFITMAMTGSSIWMIEIFFNFRLFYSMPLCLYFFIKTIDTNRLKYFFLSLSILFLTSSWGNALYIGVFECLFFSVFAFFYFFIHKVNLKKFKKNLDLADILTLAAFLILAAASIAFLLVPGLPAFISPGRSFDGKLDYLDFLRFNKDHYTTSMNGILFGLREWRDGTVYTGFLTMPFVLLAFIYRPLKIIVPFMGAAAFTFFLYLSEESFIAPLLFFLPGVRLVRHGYLLTPYIKFCLLFIAGFGVDYFYTSSLRQGKRFNTLLKFLTIAVSILSFAFFIDWKVVGKDAKSLSVCYILIVYLITFFSLHFWRKKIIKPAIIFITILSAIDIYNYKVGYVHNTHVALPTEEWDLFKPRKINFFKERTNKNNYSDFREKLDNPIGFSMLNVIEQFFGSDKCGGQYRSDTTTQSSRDLYYFIEPKYKFNYSLDPTLEKTIACGYPKFQIFDYPPLRTAEDVPDRKEFLKKIQPTFRTQPQTRNIFLNTWRSFSGEPKHKEDIGTRLTPRNIHFDFYNQFIETLKIHPLLLSPYSAPEVQILNFNANNIQFNVSTKIKKPELWLYIAEAWHPKWKAYVNGKEEKIEVANLAFRTFPVPSGESKIEMIYNCRIENVLIWIVWAFSALLFIFVVLQTLLLCLNPSLPLVKKWSKMLGSLE